MLKYILASKKTEPLTLLLPPPPAAAAAPPPDPVKWGRNGNSAFLDTESKFNLI